jgi:4-alpha-glucanotransferase
MTKERLSGILLHPTSLPGPCGIGDLGPTAHAWLEFLVESETALWQILPIGPTGFGDSPYQSFSSFAGNPLLISPESLAADGLVEGPPAATTTQQVDRVDFGEASTVKTEMLRAAHTAFVSCADDGLRIDFDRFTTKHSSWLADFALFMALKVEHDGHAWTDWPVEHRDRHPGALAEAAERLADEVDFHRFCQFVFFRQWAALRSAARHSGITIIGDLPIYVAGDSVDVWTDPHLFRLDRDRRPSAVAGVPPDSFSATGQLWGNPLYNWTAHEDDGFEWWIERIRAAVDLVDIVRVDHFRAFADYWEIPRDAGTAEVGRWRDGPGDALFSAVESALGPLPLIAEDLGDLSPKVAELRDALGLPGMRLLQGAFGGNPDHQFLPHRYPPNSMAYTGTHDNNTSAGWYELASAEKRAFARRYLSWDGDDPAWTFISAVWKSAAGFAIAPLQDFLRLGTESRMNTPATTGGNWQWRVKGEALTSDLAKEIRTLNRETGRASPLTEPRTQNPEPRPA